MFSSNPTDTAVNPLHLLSKNGLKTDTSSHVPRKPTKVYSALYESDAHLSSRFGELEVLHHPVEMVDTNSILILHGGADISPSLYGQKPGKFTGADEELSPRDLSEVLLAKRAIELGIPIFGICRGAQLACSLAGGTLVQHTTGHGGGSHEIVTNDGKLYESTTCHHQMMNPWQVPHELLAWAAPSLSKFYLEEQEKQVKMSLEPEVVFFPQIKCVAVQGHPEWMATASPFVQYCLNLIEEKLL